MLHIEAALIVKLQNTVHNLYRQRYTGLLDSYLNNTNSMCFLSNSAEKKFVPFYMTENLNITLVVILHFPNECLSLKN